jgi:hypothetical protein
MSVTPKCAGKAVQVLKVMSSLPGIQEVAQASPLGLNNTYNACLDGLIIQMPSFLAGNDAEA